GRLNAGNLATVGASYFDERDVFIDLSDSAVRDNFITSESDVLLNELFDSPIFGNFGGRAALDPLTAEPVPTDGIQIRGPGTTNGYGFALSPKINFDVTGATDQTYLK